MTPGEFWAETLMLARALDKRSYYQILGVTQDASEEEIIEAYRRRREELDPARHSGEPDEERRRAVALVHARLGEAFVVLSDGGTRHTYDEALEQGLVRLPNRAGGGPEPTPAAAPPASPAPPPKPVATFAREHTRHAVVRPIKVSCANWGQFITLHTRNISRGGMFVKTPTPPEVGTLVRVKFALPTGRLLELDAEVARVVAPERIEGSPATAGMGLRFLDIDADTQQLIDGLLEEARAASAPPRRPTPRQPPPVPEDREEPAVTAARQELLAEVARMREARDADVLGASIDAGSEGIRAAYVALAKRFHPDLWGKLRSAAVADLASEAFALVRRAYERLVAGAVAEAMTPPPSSLPIRPLLDIEAFDLATMAAGHRTLDPGVVGDLQARRWSEAREKLAVAISRKPDDRVVRAAFHLASAYEAQRQGQNEEARRQFESVLEYDRHCAEAIRELRREKGEP